MVKRDLTKMEIAALVALADKFLNEKEVRVSIEVNALIQSAVEQFKINGNKVYVS